jgi:hypothetical protein
MCVVFDYRNRGDFKMSTAIRNRLIKKVLTQAFGAGKVTVRGSRGTGYGWVSVDIDYTPRTRDEREELNRKIWSLFGAAKIEIDTFGYNDPGSDYGYGSKIHLNFNPVERNEWA